MRKAILTVMLIGALATGALALTGVLSTVKASASGAVAAAQNSSLGAGLVLHQGGGVGTENLAEALGISTDELQTAVNEARTAAIDQALAEGQITQEQADALKAGTGRAGLGGKRGAAALDVDYNALLAEALGISVDELNQAYDKAAQASIDDAVADGRLTQEEADLLRARQALYNSEAFQSSMQSAFEDAVNAAVQSGVITQQQADQILADAPAFGGGMRGWKGGWLEGGRGMGRGAGHGLPQAIPDNQPQTTPDVTTTPGGSSG